MQAPDGAAEALARGTNFFRRSAAQGLRMCLFPRLVPWAAFFRCSAASVASGRCQCNAGRSFKPCTIFPSAAFSSFNRSYTLFSGKYWSAILTKMFPCLASDVQSC